MTNDEKLIILKQDLQQTGTTANEPYLKHLMEYAGSAMNRIGIKEEETIEYGTLQVQYAAYLFRKRAAPETEMPKFLRRGLNNLKFSREAGNDV